MSGRGFLRLAGALLVLGGAAAGAASCKTTGVSLSVDLRTDYLPGREFVRVHTEVVPSGGDQQAMEHAVAPTDGQFVDGSRVADFGDLPTGDLQVKVQVISPEGNAMVERLARVSVNADYALTLVITRNCEGITCPTPGGDPALATCDKGQCVRAECTPSTPQYCAPPECSFDADCKADVSCVAGRCVGGTCLFLPVDAKCDPKQTCDPTVGCTPPLSTCTPTGAAETVCNDGKDDDCDGRIDCDDPDCDTKACEDGDLCTEGETCQMAACVGGTAKKCDDGNVCTDDSCDPKVGCTKTNNTIPCDDGTYCNGADTCGGGTCSAHAGDPCAKGCDEANKKCLSCAVDADCGPVTYGAWGACGGFANTCATGGTQSRSVTTPKCVAGACSNVASTQSQACTRVTTGTACGTTTYGAWSACGGFSSACDTNGTRTRTKTTYACNATGTCAATNTTESGTCTRTVANGTSCGTGKYCCSGGCYAKNNVNHCSSCGIKCSSGTCASIGGGQYSCTCSSNAQCQGDGFGSGATCWAPTGGQMYCNCQCTTANCCAGGADCKKPSGNNYCSY